MYKQLFLAMALGFLVGALSFILMARTEFVKERLHDRKVPDNDRVLVYIFIISFVLSAVVVALTMYILQKSPS